jgi:hypothetical protein
VLQAELIVWGLCLLGGGGDGGGVVYLGREWGLSSGTCHLEGQSAACSAWTSQLMQRAMFLATQG